MLRGRPAILTYTAINTSTQTAATGDAANHTIYIVKDGVQAAATNSPFEIGVGEYGVFATPDETDAESVLVSGTSSTSNVQLVGTKRATTSKPYRASAGTLIDVMNRRTSGARADISINNTTRTIMAAAHRQRIQKNGTLGHVRVMFDTKSTLVSWKVRVWRMNDGSSPTTWDEVGVSNDILAADTGTNDVWKLYSLETPIPGVRAGDFLSIAVETSGGSSNLAGYGDGLNIEDYVTRWNEGDTTGTAQQFTNEINGRAPAICAVMYSPGVVCFGDSFLGQVSNTQAFNYPLASGAWEDQIAGRSIPDRMYGRDPTLCDMVNRSIPGSSAWQWINEGGAGAFTWLDDYVLALDPQYVVISLGVNDKAGTGSHAARTFTEFKGDLDAITQRVTENDATPVVLTLMHTNASLSYKRTWNRWLAEHCRKHGFPLVDAWRALASIGDLDTRATAFGADVHPNPAGCIAVADRVVDELLTRGW